MTPRQKAILALLTTAAAGGGMLTGQQVTSILARECGAEESRVEDAVRGETTITLRRAAGLTATFCRGDALGVAVEIEIKLLKGKE